MSENLDRSGWRRREFLRTGARWAAAGVVVGGTVWGISREASAACRRASACGACPEFESGCGLPKAVDWRRTSPESEANP